MPIKMTEEQQHSALDAYRHLTRAAECAERAGLLGTARRIRLERIAVDQAIATAEQAPSSQPPEAP